MGECILTPFQSSMIHIINNHCFFSLTKKSHMKYWLVIISFILVFKLFTLCYSYKWWWNFKAGTKLFWHWYWVIIFSTWWIIWRMVYIQSMYILRTLDIHHFRLFTLVTQLVKTTHVAHNNFRKPFYTGSQLNLVSRKSFL